MSLTDMALTVTVDDNVIIYLNWSYMCDMGVMLTAALERRYVFQNMVLKYSSKKKS